MNFSFCSLGGEPSPSVFTIFLSIRQTFFPVPNLMRCHKNGSTQTLLSEQETAGPQCTKNWTGHEGPTPTAAWFVENYAHPICAFLSKMRGLVWSREEKGISNIMLFQLIIRNCLKCIVSSSEALRGSLGSNCNWLVMSAIDLPLGVYMCRTFSSQVYRSSKDPVNSATLTQWNIALPYLWHEACVHTQRLLYLFGLAPSPPSPEQLSLILCFQGQEPYNKIKYLLIYHTHITASCPWVQENGSER